ncbi:MAG: transcription antiterminator [Tepidanaerobacter acetatoxydans]|uniref:BglG family transcription antiterminator n=1 Tax=Tepidanaerobacter acetatoxydans TaxID=499229 RepID=UPI0026F0D3FC|nr:BglG family transcription antiterminator [Tepidanaerobacter acetatoxydans]NLU11576.1 transcription antiterminator [Tepidanaerobacter acetatoxydans]
MSKVNLTPRQKLILEILYKENRWLKGGEIAVKLGITARTVRNDIQQLNSEFNIEPTLIASSKRKGYIVANREKAEDILEHLKSSQNNLPIYPDERVNFILKKLLFEKTEINIFDLADELTVSDCTIENDLIKVKKIIAESSQNLNLKRNSDNISLEGSEDSKRNLLSQLLFKEAGNNFLNISKYDTYFEDLNMSVIQDIVLSSIKKHNFVINEIGLLNLVIHIAITIKRIKSNHFIEDSPCPESFLKTNEYKLAVEIGQGILEKFGIRLPEQEILYIGYMILGKRILKSKCSSFHYLENVIESKYIKITQKLIESIYDNFGINFLGDEDLLIGLSMHIKAMDSRIQSSIILRNPILDELKHRYPFIFELAVFLSNEFYKFTNIQMNENEIGFFALHLGAAFERFNQKTASKKKVALICTENLRDILRSKIMAEFGNKLEIADVLSIIEYDKAKNMELDFIISTADLQGHFNIPVIFISPFLDNKDVQEINKQLNFFEIAMNVRGVISRIDQAIVEELFFPDLAIEDSFEVMKFLADKLYEKGYVPETYFDSVVERESLSSTSFGNMVAIPHALIMNAYQTTITVGILKKPIEWGDYKVQLVFMFAINESDVKNLQNLYKYLMQILDDPHAVSRLIKARKFDEFKQIILDYYAAK